MLTTTADGSMATVATRRKNLLTETGLLMEGDSATLRFSFAKNRLQRDVSLLGPMLANWQGPMRMAFGQPDAPRVSPAQPGVQL